jgi:hypothetical protein
MDYIKQGKYFFHYQYPPALNKEDIFIFQDGLMEIADTKLKDCWRRYKWLKTVESIYDEIYIEHKDCSQWTKDLILIFKTTELVEIHYLKKWIKYWYLITKFLQPQADTFESWTITVEKARSYSLESLYTGQLKRCGNRLVGLCPFHQEKTPSFYIFESNHFKCFGCGKFGDSIDFYMELKGCGFAEAVKEMT